MSLAKGANANPTPLPEFPRELSGLEDGALLDPPVEFGAYRIERLVRSSEMSVVCRAERRESGQRVALKFCRRSDFRKRFEREIRYLQTFREPGLPHVLASDVGRTSDGGLFFATRWIEGPTLGAFLADPKVPRDAKIRVVVDLAGVVGKVHEKDLTHRDLKPSNVIVEVGRGNRPNLIDLGNADDAYDPDLTSTLHPLAWTRGYCPAWARNPGSGAVRDTGPSLRRDVFALAVILVEALTGVRPGGDDDPNFTPEGVRRVLAGQHESARAFLPVLQACFGPMDQVPADAKLLHKKLEDLAKPAGNRAPLAGPTPAPSMVGWAWAAFVIVLLIGMVVVSPAARSLWKKGADPTGDRGPKGATTNASAAIDASAVDGTILRYGASNAAVRTNLADDRGKNSVEPRGDVAPLAAGPESGSSGWGRLAGLGGGAGMIALAGLAWWASIHRRRMARREPWPPVERGDEGTVRFVVRLQVSPAGAVVRVLDNRANGRLVVPEQTAPTTGEVELALPEPEGRDWSLLVTKPGFQPIRQAVRAGDGGVTIRLEKLRAEVLFRVLPGARVTLRGRGGVEHFTDPAPADGRLRVQGLEEGQWSYRVELRDHRTVEGRLTDLVHGLIQEVPVSLEPLPGRLSVSGHPALEIWSTGADARRLGAADVWITLAAGAHALELRRPGFQPKPWSVTVPPNADLAQIAPTLEAESAPRVVAMPHVVTARRLPADLIEVPEARPAPLAELFAGSAEAQQRQLAEARRLGLPLEVRAAKSGIVFRFVPAGRFMMGSPADEPGRSSDESQHEVTLSLGFWCGKFPVTRRQVRAVLGTDPSHFKDHDEAPVENMSWDDVQSLVETLCRLEGVPKDTYRLLTEAEWEYANRAGTTAATYGPLERIAWYGANSGHKTHPVGGKLANAWGLHDTIGNVWEWTKDWYDSYPQGSVTDPAGPGSGAYRVFRGGGWLDDPARCRSADRLRDLPGLRIRGLGFRLARRL